MLCVVYTEWARDQFALVFTKLVKHCETAAQTPSRFEEEMRSLTDSAQGMYIHIITLYVYVYPHVNSLPTPTMHY